MPELTPKQLKKLTRVASLKDDSELVLLESIEEIDTKLNDRIDLLEESIGNKINLLTEDIKKKDIEFAESVLEIDTEELKGEKGDAYILTDKDKRDIANSIKVPVVEKVVERIEVLNEQPIDTNNIALEASIMAQEQLKPLIPSITPLEEQASKIVSIIDSRIVGEKVKIDSIENLRVELERAKRASEDHRVVGANRNLYQLLDVNVSGITVNQSIKWNGTQWVAYTPSSGGSSDFDKILTSQLYEVLVDYKGNVLSSA